MFTFAELDGPTHEHSAPVLAALGASIDRADPVAFPITGWVGGNLTRRSIQFGEV